MFPFGKAERPRESVMLALMKMGWVGAAVSAGLTAALPATHALPARERTPVLVSGKTYVQRLGESGKGGPTAHIVSPLADNLAVGSARGDRRKIQDDRPPASIITVEQRRDGMSLLMRLPSDQASLQ